MKLAALLAFTAVSVAFAAADPTDLKRDPSLRNEVRIAIDKGLASLQKAQNPDGSWSMVDFPALTALPLTAFMLEPEGKFRREKPDFIKKGYESVLGAVKPDGGIYRKGLANYNTSIAAIALVAAEEPKFEPVIRAARDFIIGQQARGMVNPALDGGIGYGPIGTESQKPDLSNTVYALEALYRTKIATGEKLANAKDLNWPAVIAFIERCQDLHDSAKDPAGSAAAENRGGFAYSPGTSKAGEITLPDGKKLARSYGSMSYAGLLSYIYADLKKDDPRVTAVVGWLKSHYTLEENPGMGGDGLYYYYQMLAKAMFAHGATEMTLADGRKVDWRQDLAKKLIDLQKPDGSWSNEKGRWMEKDPVLVTSYSLLALEFIYRAL